MQQNLNCEVALTSLQEHSTKQLKLTIYTFVAARNLAKDRNIAHVFRTLILTVRRQQRRCRQFKLRQLNQCTSTAEIIAASPLFSTRRLPGLQINLNEEVGPFQENLSSPRRELARRHHLGVASGGRWGHAIGSKAVHQSSTAAWIGYTQKSRH